MKKYCYLNGKIIAENKAGIPINDIGILRAYACFEYLRTYNGKIFLFNEHWQRLQNSAVAMNIKIPVSRQRLKDIIKKLMNKNKLKDASIRIVLTGGKTPDSSKFDKNKATFFILIDKIHIYPKSFYKDGVTLITHEFQRQNHETKTINYIEAIKLKNHNQKKLFHDILYYYGGKVLEASTGNFFVIKGNRVITPGKNILIGTTRNLVIKLAKKQFNIEERDIRLSELKSADEAFITSTTRDIMPVVKIDKQKIGNGKVGEKTRHLIKIFEKYTKNY